MLNVVVMEERIVWRMWEMLGSIQRRGKMMVS